MAAKQTRRTTAVAPTLFEKMEQRAIQEKTSKSALVERLIKNWLAGEPSPRKPNHIVYESPMRKARGKAKEKRWIVNVDLTVHAKDKEDALRVTGKLLAQEKIQGTPLCADEEA